MNARAIGSFALAFAFGCQPPVTSGTSPAGPLRRDLELTDEQSAYLRALAERADAAPADFAARKASGMAHMRFTLSGVLSLRDRAEADLEAAFALDPTDRQLTRSLGRFYNLRAVEGDDSKAAEQVEVYTAHLGDRDVAGMSTSDFVAWSFYQLGVVLSHRNEGRLLKALSTIESLEEALAERVRQRPDDVEVHALAGNFAFFFAGNLPFGKETRVRAAVDYFRHLRGQWDRLRPGANDPEHCPNTYENFMFELAEGLLVLEEKDEAAAIYRELSTIRAPRTRAKEQIAFVARERLEHLDAYAGDMDLMPPWPSDVGNCVVCHAYTSDVPMTSLHIERPIGLDDIPTEARPKPVPVGPLPADVRSIVDRRCVGCHRPGGEGAELADFSTDEGVLATKGLAEQLVRTEIMPPEHAPEPMPDDERSALLRWLRP